MEDPHGFLNKKRKEIKKRPQDNDAAHILHHTKNEDAATTAESVASRVKHKTTVKQKQILRSASATFVVAANAFGAIHRRNKSWIYAHLKTCDSVYESDDYSD